MTRRAPSGETVDVDAIVDRVLQRIGELAAKASQPSTYSDRKGCGPAGVPDRENKKIVRQIGRKPYPGARWYVVSREAYEAFIAGSATPSAPANDAAREPWSPARALASAGLRPAGGAR